VTTKTPVRLENARKAAEGLVARLQISTVPVDVVSVARALGLKVIYNDLGEDISGLLVTRDSDAAICVREGEPIVRQRFTIAHEIGHFFLRHQFESGEHVHVDQGFKMTARSSKRTLALDPKEVEANQFAAALLMPSELLRERVKRFNVVHLDDDHVAELAGDFKVSEQAMAIRLNGLGL
jgi:Zn-dependent peptidase ImmA (M78 family)